MRHFSLHNAIDTPSHTPAHTQLLAHKPLNYRLWDLAFKKQPHQQNVNRSGSHMQSSQTLWATSPVLPSTSRCSQTPLELSKVLSDSARAFSGAPESTCSYGGAFRMLWDLTYRIVEFWSSWDLCADLRETSRTAETAAGDCESSRHCCTALRETGYRILTAVVHTQPHGISSYHIHLCYSHKIHYIIIWHALFKSLYIYTCCRSGRR